MAMIFKLFFSLRNKERIVFENLKACKHELGVGNTARFASYLFIEYEALNDWDQSIYQEIVGALLHFLFYNFTSAFVDNAIDLSVSIWCCMH